MQGAKENEEQRTRGAPQIYKTAIKNTAEGQRFVEPANWTFYNGLARQSLQMPPIEAATTFTFKPGGFPLQPAP